MNDREKLKALLDEWGVPYCERREKETSTDRKLHVVSIGYAPHVNPGAKASPKVGGYVGFFTDFDFDPDGNFLRVGAWE